MKFNYGAFETYTDRLIAKKNRLGDYFLPFLNL